MHDLRRMDSADAGVELKPPGPHGEVEAGSIEFMAIFQMLQEHWLGSFLLNVLGYALIILPTALLIRRWKNDPQIKRGQCKTISIIN